MLRLAGDSLTATLGGKLVLAAVPGFLICEELVQFKQRGAGPHFLFAKSRSLELVLGFVICGECVLWYHVLVVSCALPPTVACDPRFSYLLSRLSVHPTVQQLQFDQCILNACVICSLGLTQRHFNRAHALLPN